MRKGGRDKNSRPPLPETVDKKRGLFEAVTNSGPLTLTGQVQEFIVQTPEPGTLALLICGMLALCVRLPRRGQLTA
jgi:hypothetical protein